MNDAEPTTPDELKKSKIQALPETDPYPWRHLDTSLQAIDYGALVNKKERDLPTAIDLYRNEIDTILERVFAAKDIRSGASQMKQLIRGMAEQAYVEGMRDGGIKEAEEALDEEDRKTIQDWIDGQLAHVRDFLAYAHEQGNSGGVLERSELWVQSFAALGHMGRLSAQSNAFGTWRMGNTKEHCKTCLSLHGQRHRLKWFTSRGYIPREPDSEALECGGWNCQCGIYDDSDNPII